MRLLILYLKLVKQVLLAELQKFFKLRLPACHNVVELYVVLKCFSNLVGPGNHIKRILVENVFVRWFLPAKMIAVKVKSHLYHRNACLYRFKGFSIEYVNLRSATSDAAVLLKRWLE